MYGHTVSYIQVKSSAGTGNSAQKNSNEQTKTRESVNNSIRTCLQV